MTGVAGTKPWHVLDVTNAEGALYLFHDFGVSLVLALTDDNDAAALRFLELLPLDCRLAFGAVSKRWAGLARTPSLWSALRFDEVALPERFGGTISQPQRALSVVAGVLARATQWQKGTLLKFRDRRLLIAPAGLKTFAWDWHIPEDWMRTYAPGISTFNLVLALLVQATRSGCTSRSTLRELRFGPSCPLLLKAPLLALRRLAPKLNFLACKLHLELSGTKKAAALAFRKTLGLLPKQGDVRLVMHVAKLESSRAKVLTAEEVAALFGKAQCITRLSLDERFVPHPGPHIAGEEEEVTDMEALWAREFVVPLLRGLARSRNSVARIDFPKMHDLSGGTLKALLELIRCAGRGSGGGATANKKTGCLHTVDLRRVWFCSAQSEAALCAEGAAHGVEVLVHEFDDGYSEGN